MKTSRNYNPNDIRNTNVTWAVKTGLIGFVIIMLAVIGIS